MNIKRYLLFDRFKQAFKLIAAFLFICLSINTAFGQIRSVTGKVTDNEGNSLSGATVLEKGTTNGVQSGLDGSFAIKLTTNNPVLQVSFIGYQTFEIAVGDQKAIKVILKLAQAHDDVVVIGYGKSNKRDLTGAISSVSAKDFEKQPVFRVEDALQGRASGVNVTKNSGAPGADVKIRIRGANSINGDNQPLVVIDGVIGADLRSVNTNDIASMEILKDASATAIYGSRGANGVVLISTKRGKGKPSINVDAFTSVSSVTKTIDLLSAEEFSAINNTPVKDGGADYQKEYFRKGYTKNLQASLSGKADKLGYFVSGNILDQSGIAINSNYRRYSLRSNLDIPFNDRLKVQLNLSGSSEKSHNLEANGILSSPDLRGGISAVLGWDPTIPVKDADGNYNLLGGGSSLVNPIAQRIESDNNITTTNINTNLNISYDITHELNLTVIGGLLYRNAFAERYSGIPAGTALGNISGTSGSGHSQYSTILQNSNILTWANHFNKHNIKLTGLFEVQKNVSKAMSLSGGEYIIPGNFYTIDLGTQPNVGASLAKYEILSYMGRAEYNYDRKLFLTGTLRADVSSKFRPGKQLGLFPSGSAAYQFGSLFDDAIESFKLRVGYGEVGNQGVPPYSTYNTLALGANYPLNGTTNNSGIGLTGGNLGNSDLTWETTKQTNVGADFSFFDGRALLSINKYWKNTTNLLLDVPVADFLGGGFITQNVGEVFNGGWEASLDFSPISNKKFSWNFNANYSYNQSKVKALYGGVDEIFFNPAGNISNVSGSYVRVKVGEPLGQFYGVTALGAYQTGDPDGKPGNARYLKDENGKEVLGVIGNGVPKHTWAFNNTFAYRKFDLNFLLRGAHGFDVMNITRSKISMSGGTQGGPTYGEYRDRWTPQKETNIPAGGDLFVNSTRFVENGSFIRLTSLAIGYNIDGIKLFSKARVYANAQNLFTLTKYKGFDPEASSTDVSSGTGSSIDYGANPNARSFTLGINFTF